MCAAFCGLEYRCCLLYNLSYSSFRHMVGLLVYNNTSRCRPRHVGRVAPARFLSATCGANIFLSEGRGNKFRADSHLFRSIAFINLNSNMCVCRCNYGVVSVHPVSSYSPILYSPLAFRRAPSCRVNSAQYDASLRNKHVVRFLGSASNVITPPSYC